MTLFIGGILPVLRMALPLLLMLSFFVRETHADSTTVSADPVRIIFEDMMFVQNPDDNDGVIRKVLNLRNMALIGKTSEINKENFWKVLEEYYQLTKVQYNFTKEGNWHLVFVFSDNIIDTINYEYDWIWKELIPENTKQYRADTTKKILERGAKCYGILNSSDSIVSGAAVFIDNSASEKKVLKCINQYLFSIFGFAGLTSRISSVKSLDDEHFLLSEAEADALKILYDPKVKPGMSKEDFYRYYDFLKYKP